MANKTGIVLGVLEEMEKGKIQDVVEKLQDHPAFVGMSDQRINSVVGKAIYSLKNTGRIRRTGPSMYEFVTKEVTNPPRDSPRRITDSYYTEEMLREDEYVADPSESANFDD